MKGGCQNQHISLRLERAIDMLPGFSIDMPLNILRNPKGVVDEAKKNLTECKFVDIMRTNPVFETLLSGEVH